MDIAQALEGLTPAAEYFGSLTHNTEAAFDALDWHDSRTKPAWATIVAQDEILQKAALKDYLANKRWLVEAGGIIVNSIDVPTNDTAQRKVAELRQRAESSEITLPFNFKSLSGWVSLDLVAIQTVDLAVAAHVQACYAKEAALDADIDSDTITTTQQIDTATWPG